MTTPVIAYAIKVRSPASGGWYWLSSAGDMGCHHGYRMLVSSREHALREASLRGYSRDNTRLVKVPRTKDWDVVPPPGLPSVDHGCIACGQAAPPIYCCIPCSDKEAYAAAAVARRLALEEAERIARDPNVPLTGIADAIAAIRGSK